MVIRSDWATVKFGTTTSDCLYLFTAIRWASIQQDVGRNRYGLDPGTPRFLDSDRDREDASEKSTGQIAREVVV